ncbi:MAG TPA: glycosyltransferase family 39 protein [Chthoniobacterales bacterium]
MAWRKSAIIFLATFALYFLSRSPGLDEIDSVNFAMGVREFNVWEHQPHPPGYPLYIFFGWIGTKVFGASPQLSLHFVSALGGALFVAAWFLIVRLQFHERLAWWTTSCLAMTPVVWMTATKVLSDAPAAGCLSAAILAAVWFAQRGGLPALLAIALSGAAAIGMRPQLIPMVVIILAIALKRGRAELKMSILACGALVAGCLLWLGPMWYSQWKLHPEVPAWLVYPKLIYSQWEWRYDRPDVFIGAGDWSARYLLTRFVQHFLGIFGLGFGFLQSWVALIAGSAVVLVGFAGYFSRRREPDDRQFWRFHASWALVHIVIIFVCLPPTQRYYLIIYPLVLIALLRGFLRLAVPWNRIALAVPAILLFTSIPIAIINHREDAPPERFVQYLKQLYPPDARSRVVLLLSNRSRRHVEWYAPEFRIVRHPTNLSADDVSKATKDAVAIYTDDEKFALPRGWRRVALTEFRRSVVIYIKSSRVRLLLVDRGSG